MVRQIRRVVTLKQVDMIIDRGANYGWVNRGKEVCLVACAVINTEHLDRSVYRDTMVLKGDEKI